MPTDTLISEGVDIDQMAAVENSQPPGLYDIRFYLTEPVSAGDKTLIVQDLRAAGVQLIGIDSRKSDGLWYVSVKYRRPEPPPPGEYAFLPLAVIPLIGFGLIATLVGIGIFKMEDITNNIVKILAIGGGIIIVTAALLRQPATEYIRKL